MTSFNTCLSAASNFDRILAKHLAARIAEGVHCDEPVVRRCYAQTKAALDIGSGPADDPLTDEIESCFVRTVVELMERHQRFIAQMSEPLASTFIAELLFEKPW